MRQSTINLFRRATQSAIVLLLLFSGSILARQTKKAQKAAEFSLPDLNSKTVKLSDFYGKIVLLDFWATWCKPCLMEIPHLKELYSTYRSRGFEIVGVTFQSGSASDIAKTVEKNQIPWLVVIGNDKVAKDYGGLVGYPTQFLVDRKGNLVQKLLGYRTKKQLEAEIKKVLNE